MNTDQKQGAPLTNQPTAAPGTMETQAGTIPVAFYDFKKKGGGK